MIIDREVFLKINGSLQSEFQYSLQVAARNAWITPMVSEVEGRGAEDVRAFLADDLRLRVGAGTEYFDLEVLGQLHIEHAQVSGGFVVRDRDVVSPQGKELLRSAASGLAEAAVLTKQKLVLDLINANAVAYDGLPFFSTGHFVNYKDADAGTYDNAETGKDLTADNLAAAIATIEDRKMPGGTPRNLKARWLLHAPALKKQAIDATGAQFVTTPGPTSAASEIRTSFGVVPVTVPGLAKVGGKDVWIVCADDGMGSALSRPFGISTLIEIAITNFSGITAPQLARMQELEYLSGGDLAAYPGHPFLAHRCAVV